MSVPKVLPHSFSWHTRIIQSQIDGHSGYFQSFSFTDKAAINNLCICHSSCVLVQVHMRIDSQKQDRLDRFLEVGQDRFLEVESGDQICQGWVQSRGMKCSGLCWERALWQLHGEGIGRGKAGKAGDEEVILPFVDSMNLYLVYLCFGHFAIE